MLQPILNSINTQNIVLASSSPRRKQILSNIGLKFKTLSSTFEENLDKDAFKSAADYALKTAEFKVFDVANKLSESGEYPDLLIGADTVVCMNNVIYEKPRDKVHAVEILSGFSGRTHQVHTGVILLTPSSRERKDVRSFYDAVKFTECSDVSMATLSSKVIKAYVDTNEPMDKAGAYGIQGIGGTLISSVHGDYFNVMGFPLHSFCKHLLNIYRDKYNITV